MWCSSMQSQTGFHQDGPYPGVRSLGRNYPKADWGVARYPAMLIDLPFSTVFDTLALPLDSLGWPQVIPKKESAGA